MPSRQDIEKAASSKTLQKCLNELDGILTFRQFPKSHSPRRAEYHEMLETVLENIAITWYKVGVRRGHRMSARSGSAPSRLKFTRTLKSNIFSGGVKVTVKSSLPKSNRNRKKAH
jgi:hypothetical protein